MYLLTFTKTSPNPDQNDSRFPIETEKTFSVCEIETAVRMAYEFLTAKGFYNPNNPDHRYINDSALTVALGSPSLYLEEEKKLDLQFSGHNDYLLRVIDELFTSIVQSKSLVFADLKYEVVYAVNYDCNLFTREVCLTKRES